MERHEYLVIYQLDSNEQSITELPIDVFFYKGANADEKYNIIKEEVRLNEGNIDRFNIKILGIYKL